MHAGGARRHLKVNLGLLSGTDIDLDGALQAIYEAPDARRHACPGCEVFANSWHQHGALLLAGIEDEKQLMRLVLRELRASCRNACQLANAVIDKVDAKLRSVAGAVSADGGGGGGGGGGGCHAFDAGSKAS